jgi:mannose/cellobiose epimerase-like protein (N-acyl-D-glucosamine 2-epimerase family)
MRKRFENWLTHDAIPLWQGSGIDWKDGGFFEALALEDATPLNQPKRALVQARQIYSFRVARDLGIVPAETARKIIAHGSDFLLKHYRLPTGEFIHSVEKDGKPIKIIPELYTQAFALFGLAHAYAVDPQPEILIVAKALLKYLHSERRVPSGGFSEIQNGNTAYESNPHMHLFEAALSWMDVDPDPEWRKLADELLQLCLDKFLNSGVIAEHFDAHWVPLKTDGRFVFEPGHQYEWLWLMGRYEKHTGKDLLSVRKQLFDQCEKVSICPTRKVVFDEMWSDMTPKTKSSRFWTQCERIKAASSFDSGEKTVDEAVQALLMFFETPKSGLWFDGCSESSEFSHQPAKASSLYHIIGAMGELL